MRELPSPTDIVRVFEQHPGRTFRLRELVVALGLRSSQARELKQALKDLSKRGKIDYLKKNHFALVTHGRCDPDEARSRTSHAAESARGAGGARRHSVSGRLIGHRDGYGFVVPDQPVAGSSQDIFIPPGGMGSAMHGDRVDVEVVRARTGRRPGAGGGGGGKVEERLEGRV